MPCLSTMFNTVSSVPPKPWHIWQTVYCPSEISDRQLDNKASNLGLFHYRKFVCDITLHLKFKCIKVLFGYNCSQLFNHSVVLYKHHNYILYRIPICFINWEGAMNKVDVTICDLQAYFGHITCDTIITDLSNNMLYSTLYPDFVFYTSREKHGYYSDISMDWIQTW